MLEEALTALAATGGTAVVQAAGTSSWQGLQHAVARWFGRGQEDRELAARERLALSAAALAESDAETVVHIRVREQALWQARIETVLESLGDDERESAVAALRVVLREQATSSAVSAGDDGQAIGGSVHISAHHGAAALRMGDVNLSYPSPPGLQQG